MGCIWAACGLPICGPYVAHKVWTQSLLQPNHMGHIWAAYGPHMGTWFAAYGAFSTYGEKILQKAQHIGNIWVSFSNIWGSSETYRSFLKHMGPFRNIWGLSETYGAFRERSLFLFPTCHIALFRYMSFFSLSKVLPITNQAHS